MATPNSNDDGPIPFQITLETNSNLSQSAPQKYDDFMASLPLTTLDHRRIRLYQGFWIPEDYLRGVLTIQEHFTSRPNDLFVASYPKSGTTWLKALIFATMTRKKYPLDQNPLLVYNPHQCIVYIDKHCSLGRSRIVEAIPSPRVLSTHIPYSILPDSITGSDCRMIYVWRDPKDVIVSLWHFAQKVYEGTPNLPSFSESFELFCEGKSYFGPIWNHIIEYWQESKRKPEKVLFLKYEDMLEEPIKYARILAKFIGCPYSEAEEKQGVIEQVVGLCSFEKLKDLEVNKRGSGTILDGNFSFAAFFRKGMVGDWRNHMTSEMAQRLDGIVAEKFKEAGLEMINMKSETTLGCSD
ncbi:Sulfotransferase [Rhynchospora pubera]|uniref:Sulfotransferase n=1 Tax=Rhynchospora pubera TaxID=906938 RepID=A0AAV8FL31_9POAL|nr:Sulfotransferase [Rhynchospora pubera]